MKKHLLLLAFVLAGAFSTFATAQTTDNLLNIAGLEPDLTGQTTYYLKNVGTGLYMSYGGEHGAHCIESQQAHPLIVEENDGYVAIASLGGYLESNTLWMDWEKGTSNWTLVPVEGYTNQYYLLGDGGRALTSVGNHAGLLDLRALANSAVQRWVFVNGRDIKENKMPEATVENPFDVTVSIRGGAFDLVDVWEPAPNTPEIFKASMPYGKVWKNVLTSENTPTGEGYASNRYDTGIGHGEWDANLYNYCALIWGEGGAVERDVTYTMTLPKGTYHYSFEGFYVGIKHESVLTQTCQYKGSWRDKGTVESTTYDAEVPVTVSFKGEGLSDVQESLSSYGGEAMWNNGAGAAAEFRDNDNHKQSGIFYLSQETEVSIVIRKGTVETVTGDPVVTGQGSTLWGQAYDNTRTITTTSLSNSQIFIDEFALLYLGEDEVAEANVDPNASYKNYVNANVAEYKSALNEEGKAAFDEAFAGVVVDEIENRADYYDVIAAMERANDAGVVAHLRAEALRDANATGNFTKLITNNSFEMGDLTGWELPKGSSVQTGVRMNSELKTQGVDGSYLFNSWWNGMLLTQTVTGLPNGVYRMSVLVASGDEGNDATVYLIANDQKLGVNPPSGGGTFGDFSLKFTVTDGTATIGVVGGNDDDTSENPVGSYNEVGHWWYKADNFRLEYLADDHLVLNEGDLTIEELDETYKQVTVNRTIKPNTWSTFVVPFDIPADSLREWEVKELKSSELNEVNGNITLNFEDAEDGIKAGVPYMVRNTAIAENVEQIYLQNVKVNTMGTPIVETEHVEFIGTYTNGLVPLGSYFISGNKYYRSVNEANRDKIKGFRAYITPKDSSAQSVSYRLGAGTTGVDAADAEVTIVGVYTLGGVRIDDMQQGVNILQMSDGSVVKVIIK